MNVKDAKPDRKADCWNCDDNNFGRDCTKPAKKNGEKKGKISVTFRDDYDDDYGDGVIHTCSENRLPEYLEGYRDSDTSHLGLGIDNDRLPGIESVSSDGVSYLDQLSHLWN